MPLKLCPQCKRPFMANHEFCPRCPRVEWNQESLANVGCLLAMTLPVVFVILFWLTLIFAVFFSITGFFD